MKNNSLYIAKLYSMKENKSKKAFSKIAEYILTNIEKTNNFTIDSIAEHSNTSYATVCRFLRELGTSGIKQFKQIVIQEMSNQNKFELKLKNYSTDNSSAYDFDSISNKICDFSASVVSNCYDILKEETVNRIMACFNKADFIYFIGLGTSAVTALYAYTKMFRIKPNCSFETDIILSKMKASVMKKNDVIFAISSSGATKTIIETAKLAKQNGVKIIALCDFLQSPLSMLADISICTTVRNSNKYIDVDFPLIQGQITIIDILYACLYNQNELKASENFNKTVSAVLSDKQL